MCALPLFWAICARLAGHEILKALAGLTAWVPALPCTCLPVPAAARLRPLTPPPLLTSLPSPDIPSFCFHLITLLPAPCAQQKWVDHPDVVYCRPLAEVGARLRSPQDGFPTWIAEVMVRKPTVQVRALLC